MNMNICSLSYIATCVFFLLCPYTKVLGKISHVYVPSDLQCSSNEYFDHSGLVCVPCGSFGHALTNNDGSVGCQCDRGSTREEISCSLEQMRGGLCLDIMCTTKCSDLYLAPSENNLTCITCSHGNITHNLDDTLATFDGTVGDCTCNNPQPSLSSGFKPVSSRKLVEMFDPATGLSIKKECVQCPLNSAVISNDVLGFEEGYHVTAGASYPSNPYECVHCPDPNMYFDLNYQCKCIDGFYVTGETSIGPQKCLKHNPTYTSNYDSVQFPFINQRIKSDEFTTISLKSIIFSHYYLTAASLCEFPRSDSLGISSSLNACQTLANLCVMTYYDETSRPCAQYQFITSKRISSYHDNDNWKIMMPWLYYNQNVEDIVEDRSIQMTMGFQEAIGLHHTLTFKMAKYSMNGTLVGLESLTSQLMYCSSLFQDDKISEENLKFGYSWSREFRCRLDDLMSREMFFYDLFLVEKDCDSEDTSHDCLYPIPILNKNYIRKGDSLPNRNSFFGDESDDEYTRRFFLFDNLSGKDGDGLKIIRYASKITLQTTIQSHAPGKIYPPMLIIEYEELEITSSEINDEVFPVSFATEYTMKTDKYWAVVEVLSGFVSAITLVIWLFRVWKCHARLRKSNNMFSQGHQVEDDSLIQFVVEVIILGIHSFVIVFFPFIFLLCFYWFAFANLQGVVFIMLPPDDQYEYIFYIAFIHCLCWSQTLYVAYIIYRQCNIDIFFVDWEKASDSRDVSMWRKVLVANAFDKMQYSRKNSIEISLVMLIIWFSRHDNSSYYIGKDNIIIGLANNCFLWFMVLSIQFLVRFLWYDRYYSEPKGQRFIDLCTLAKISIVIMDERYHGFYLHCRSPYEFADCAMEKLCHDMLRETENPSHNRGLNSPGCPSGCQTFELFTSDIFQRNFRKFALAISSKQLPQHSSIRNEEGQYMCSEIQSFLVSFIEQSPPPQQEGLKRVIREPILSDKILGIFPDSRSTDSPCVLSPDQITWAHDFNFLKTTFLGIETQLILHDILLYNLVNVALRLSPFSSIAIVYIVHLVRLSIRCHFGTKNIFRKAFFNERFRFMI